MSTPRLSKTRLDRLLVERGLAPSREKAQGLILSGHVLINGQKVEKCGGAVPVDAAVRITGEPLRYVSRAGLKLEAALDHFQMDPRGKLCLDIGASTGGFTQCLLNRGASGVLAVDVGTNQLDWKIRSDPRVRSLEQTNARYLRLEQLGSKADLVTMDVSFISATLILPALPPLLNAGAGLLVLVKPQFEAGRDQVGGGGIVRDPEVHRQSVEKVSRKVEALGFSLLGVAESVLKGATGNREFFVAGTLDGLGISGCNTWRLCP
ncbi:MAG: TlyA family RNA methyltransferase [Terriglobia bacterium]